MDVSPKLSLISFLQDVPDPRGRNGRQHPLSAVLALACCAIMCGARGYSAIGQWAQDQDIDLMHRLGFTRSPIKSGGIRKVLMAIAPAALEAALTRWAEALSGSLPAADEGLPEAFALDGKSARGSFDGLSKAVHLLSLVAHRSGLTIAQCEVPSGGLDKTNEHKAALGLLSKLVIEGRLVTGDAMFCQRDLSRRIIEGGGHYLWAVKENQPTLLADIQAALDPGAEEALSPPTAAYLARVAGHGVDLGQGARPPGTTHADGHDGTEQLPGLAGRRAGRPDRIGGESRRQADHGGPLLHHERAAFGGRRRGVAGLVARPLDDREQVAPRPRREPGRRCQPDS